MKTCTKCGETKPVTEFYYRNAACKVCTRKRVMEYRSKNIEDVLARNAKYRSENKEKIRLHDSIYYQKNSEKIIKKVAKWQQDNPEMVAIRNAKWRKANLESCRAYCQNRRSREASIGGKLSTGIAEKLFKLQHGKCACCGLPLGAGFHLDHIMPIALGGSNTDDNIQLLRARCNRQKSAKHPVDFMQSRGFLL